MDPTRLRKLLEDVKRGRATVDEAARALADLPFAELGYATVDTHRSVRFGFPEVVYGEGKSPEQLLGIVEVLQYFLVPLVINNGTGEPGGSTLFFNLYLYKNFFTYQNMAYGATLAWLLFVVTLVVSLLVFRSSRRWVYYAGER